MFKYLQCLKNYPYHYIYVLRRYVIKYCGTLNIRGYQSDICTTQTGMLVKWFSIIIPNHSVCLLIDNRHYRSTREIVAF